MTFGPLPPPSSWGYEPDNGHPENGQKVSLLACVANSETDIKIPFPRTALWGPYFIMCHFQKRNNN